MWALIVGFILGLAAGAVVVAVALAPNEAKSKTEEERSGRSRWY